ncbi:uncharacterized protein LOC106179183 [Lingula anatina]|uniref:Uncharacterized protein LOC106179183 n=1 Tax=Lingula anatina TaxID=7574 RepID=A0A1S3K6P3_LINAN|nr:uncharacterized protein LOC106179183 [Lingula anatina]|eukprot:XP_013418172.2 uncharacterized protein LOC106179183 [Lingula anatina]
MSLGRDAGFYSDLCGSNETESINGSALTDDRRRYEDGPVGCPAQEEILNLVFTVAITSQILTPALGYIYDHCHFVSSRAVGIVFSVSGCLLMAFSAPGMEWLLFPGASLHLVGGFMFRTTGMQLRWLFPTRKSTIGTLISGTTDMSSFSFVLVKLAYDAGVPYRLSLIAMGCGTFVIATATTIVLSPREQVSESDDCRCGRSLRTKNSPHDASSMKCARNKEPKFDCDNYALEVDSDINVKPNPAMGNDTPDGDSKNSSNFAIPGKNEGITEGSLEKPGMDIDGFSVHNHLSTQNLFSVAEQVDASVLKENKSKVIATRVEEYVPFSSVLKNPMFWLTELWYSCNVLLIASYFGSFNAIVDYRAYGDRNLTSHYTNVFGYMQLGFSIPLALTVGHFLDRQHRGEGLIHAEPKTFITPSLITCVSGLLLWVTCAVPVLEGQYVAMVLHCMLRSFTFAVLITFIAYAFPHEHFGKGYAVQCGIQSVTGFLQFPLFSWFKSRLGGDPLYFSVTLCGISCLSLSLPIFLLRRPKVHQRGHGREDAKTTMS